MKAETIQLPKPRDIGYHYEIVSYWPGTNKPRKVRRSGMLGRYDYICLCGEIFKGWGAWGDHSFGCEEYRRYKSQNSKVGEATNGLR